jgi:hypothetical protein
MPKRQHKPHAGIRADDANSRTHAPSSTRQLHAARLMKYLCGLALVAVAWLAFVAQFSPDEEILGTLAALLTLAVSSVVWRRMQLHCSPTLEEIAAVWRLPWCVISDTTVVILILANDLLGKRAGSFYRVTEFRASDSSKGVSQRVLVTSYNTVSPNLIVIGIENQQMLFHQLKRTGVPKLVADLESAR